MPRRLQVLIDQLGADEIGYSGLASGVELLNDALSQYGKERYECNCEEGRED
ncbi:hypothetical protein SAMN05444506_12222 [Pseudomonas syringae]|uniref:Uncharacterized protein n=1 Tax=Pseudomonas syringae pv. apii TaxID=81036 RepID=A0A3M3RQ66_9PSED|nr:hypothetical protein ALQ59_02340 [Pseudomonas syringae pv. apii]RMN52836.1 hypothetical protein ALQ58_200435 [Pseudomonas syringae pv. apii]RMN98590.1 hypothetical protein ALQ49_00374 [Pseudomonas syringae pv. apii]SDZ49340.1 hypothetical protein SAMN05444506_12222 [Pseudomonas syringae]